ncbi:MAG: ankyrin repeat domain-containing protein [Flavobacterium sp.]|uniref:ankyrin repeat domain-containing protein n=1 Tax=Flavobacterium sp. TaxID=239 RepID=UPI0025BBCC16|nr:ankyrin repeat domain-containing protein [Flavobacterium sp.]MCK6608188.1 ankyrin repeat domain-containing protein [Flavobacterium sp.]
MKLIILLFFVSTVCVAQTINNKDIFDVARNGTIEDVKVLMQKNKDTINAVNTNGFTPLLLACYRGNNGVAEYLIKKINDINYVSPSGTALAAAVVKGNYYLAQKLLLYQANPNLSDEQGMVPLMYAVQFKNIKLVQLLLEHKGDKSVRDKSGKTLFEYAFFTEDQEIINLLKQ